MIVNNNEERKKILKKLFTNQTLSAILISLCGSGSVVERHLAKVNVASSNLVFRSRKKRTEVSVRFFQLYLPYGKLYCFAVIFGYRRVILCSAQLKGKYNIIANIVCNNTFALQKYHSIKDGIPLKLLFILLS